MRVLVVHESYRQPGGEDRAVAADLEILRSHGHEVLEYRRHNREIENSSNLFLGITTIWSRSSYQKLEELVTKAKPDVVHFHNTLPLISPAGLWAARRAGSRVVQTLHNYRLACPNALLYRNGAICEACLRWPIPLPAVLYGCYRQSRFATAAIATMLTVHRFIGTWRRAVDRFIVLTDSQKAKLVEAGLPEGKLLIRPNFVTPDPGMGPGMGEYALFVGRLTREKGIPALLEAWRGPVPIPLTIAGDGPLAGEVQRAAARSPSVKYLGAVPQERAIDLMRNATCLVFPSECYECLPMVLLEAFAAGLPVVATAIGGAAEIVTDGETGALVEVGDAEALASATARLLGDRRVLGRMRTACREEYLRRYTGEQGHSRLMEIYEMALHGAPGGSES